MSRDAAELEVREQALRWQTTLRCLGWTPKEIDRLFAACAERARTTPRMAEDYVEAAIERAKRGEPDRYGIKSRQP
jgi:hypothetical protein